MRLSRTARHSTGILGILTIYPGVTMVDDVGSKIILVRSQGMDRVLYPCSKFALRDRSDFEDDSRNVK